MPNVVAHSSAILAGTFAQSNRPNRVGGLSVLEATDKYISVKEAEGRAPSTVARYRSNRRSIQASSLGKMRVKDVKPVHVEGYIAWRRERVWGTRRKVGSRADAPPIVEVRKGAVPSNSTINRDLLLLSAVFNRLVRLGMLPENPVARVTRPKESTKQRAVLAKEEVVDLLDSCSESLRPLVLAGVFTGARANELTSLSWGDISLAFCLQVDKRPGRTRRP